MKKKYSFSTLLILWLIISLLFNTQFCCEVSAREISEFDNFSLISDNSNIESYKYEQDGSSLFFAGIPNLPLPDESKETYRLNLISGYNYYDILFQLQTNFLFPFFANFHITLESNVDHNGILNNKNFYPIGKISFLYEPSGEDVIYAITIYPNGLPERHLANFQFETGVPKTFSFSKESNANIFKINQTTSDESYDLYQFSTEANVNRPLSGISITTDSEYCTEFIINLTSFSGEFTSTDSIFNNGSFVISIDLFSLLFTIMIILPIITNFRHLMKYKRSKNS